MVLLLRSQRPSDFTILEEKMTLTLSPRFSTPHTAAHREMAALNHFVSFFFTFPRT